MRKQTSIYWKINNATDVYAQNPPLIVFISFLMYFNLFDNRNRSLKVHIKGNSNKKNPLHDIVYLFVLLKIKKNKNHKITNQQLPYIISSFFSLAFS